MRVNDNGMSLRTHYKNQIKWIALALMAVIGLLCIGESTSQAQGILQRMMDRRAQMRSYRTVPAQPHRTQSSLNQTRGTVPQYRQQSAATGQRQYQPSGQLVIDPRTGRTYIVPSPVQRNANQTAAATPSSSQKPAIDPRRNADAPSMIRPASATGPIPNPVAAKPPKDAATESMTKYGGSILYREPAPVQTPPGRFPIETQKPTVAKSLATQATPKPTAKPSAKRPTLGIEIEERQGVRGVRVMKVTPNSPAQAAGISVGDRIVSLDGEMVTGTKFMVQEITSRSVVLCFIAMLTVQHLCRSGKYRCAGGSEGRAGCSSIT